MGSLAHKIQTNQREKPRDLSVYFALPYPVECPALVTHDDVVRAWSVLFLPAFAAGNVDSFDLQVQKARDALKGKTWQWWPVRQENPSLAYVRSAVEVHLITGKTGKPCHLDGQGPIRSIGAKFRKDAPSCILNVDLDGRYDVHEVLRSFDSVGVHGLLMSSSGRPGRYRFLVFLDRWYTIDEMHVLGKTLCECVGFKANAGGLEIYPSTGNGRLPGCLGSLTRYIPTNLDAGTNLSLPEFLQEMHGLPRVNIAQIVDELKFAGERDARLVSEFSPPYPHEMHKIEHAENGQDLCKRRPEKSAYVDAPERILRWKKSGFRPGERQSGLLDLAIHAMFHGKNESETIDFLANLVRRGLIRQSDIMRERRHPIAHQIKDLPRIVRDAAAIYATFTVKKAVNALPAHLSAEDLLSLNADVERVIALGKWTRVCVERFVMTILPDFKGACIAQKVDNEGRPIVRLHWKKWRDATTKHADYVGLRDALGWFVAITDYVSTAKALAMYGDKSKAYATTWAFCPRLTGDAPTSALGSSWGAAVMRARRKSVHVCARKCS